MENVSLDKFKLPHAYMGMLCSLIEHGRGVARLDIQNRVEAGPTKTILEGDAGMWLKLFVWGCLMARDNMRDFEISPLGQAFVDEYRARLKGA